MCNSCDEQRSRVFFLGEAGSKVATISMYSEQETLQWWMWVLCTEYISRLKHWSSIVSQPPRLSWISGELRICATQFETLLKISSRFFDFSHCVGKKKNCCATGQPDFSCRVSRGSIVIIPQHYLSCVNSVHERASIQRNIKLCCLLFDLISYLAFFFIFSSSLCHSREMPTLLLAAVSMSMKMQTINQLLNQLSTLTLSLLTHGCKSQASHVFHSFKRQERR